MVCAPQRPFLLRCPSAALSYLLICARVRLRRLLPAAAPTKFVFLFLVPTSDLIRRCDYLHNPHPTTSLCAPLLRQRPALATNPRPPKHFPSSSFDTSPPQLLQELPASVTPAACVKVMSSTPTLSPHSPEQSAQSASSKCDSDANIRNFAPVARIMKSALPENAKIAKEAKECMQECVSEYISFITSEGMFATLLHYYLFGLFCQWRPHPHRSIFS